MNDRAVRWIMDLPREPVEFFDAFQSDVDARRPIRRMVDANFDAYSPEQRRGLRGQRMDQRESNEFLLCATCKRKTVFKRDGTAIKPARRIVEVSPDVYKTERYRNLRDDGRKSIKFALCSSCMRKTVYAKMQAAKYAARGHSGSRRADRRPEMRRGQGTKARAFHLHADRFTDEFAQHADRPLVSRRGVCGCVLTRNLASKGSRTFELRRKVRCCLWFGHSVERYGHPYTLTFIL